MSPQVFAAPKTEAEKKIEAEDLSATAKIKAAIKTVRENPCISKEEESNDEGYIITFIEEPLEIKNTGNKGDDFIYRPCYRNVIQYTLQKGGTKTEQALSKASAPGENGCSTTAQELTTDSSLKDYKVKYSCKEIQAILSRGGTALIYGYIGMIYKWGASIIGIIAVAVIILSGIQISASGGDPEAISKSKARIIQSIAGIAVLFLSGLILNTINPNFFTLS